MSNDDISTKQGHSHLERVDTNNVLVPTPSQFEKLYLAPEVAVAGKLRKTFGNPAPVALAGFLLANTPACIQLMGWTGAGAGSGIAAADTGAYFFLGGILLYAGGIGEWLLGNTFPSVVFFTFGGFWSVFGATLTPFYAAVSSYGTDAAGFDNSFAYFLVWMAVLCFFYMIAALRTNICLVGILFCFVFTFPLLAASYFHAGHGNLTASANCRIAGGAFGFTASVIGWWLWFSMILEAVDWPFALPVGDLSHLIKGKTERVKSEREMA